MNEPEDPPVPLWFKPLKWFVVGNSKPGDGGDPLGMLARAGCVFYALYFVLLFTPIGWAIILVNAVRIAWKMRKQDGFVVRPRKGPQ